MIYLDNAATTGVDTSFKDIIDRYLYDDYGNAGTYHELGLNAKKAINAAREQTAKAMMTEQKNIIFTSGGSEANTLAILGLAEYLRERGRKHIITSLYEHESVLNSVKELERMGFEISYCKTPAGVVSPSEIRSLMRADTGLVSVMFVNNEIGTKNDVESIYHECKTRGILFHSDCVQAFGTENVILDETADMISVSGHKIHAPKGTGCLAVNNPEILRNIIYGGEQEYGLRPGTENVPGIAAFGMAVEKACRLRGLNTTNIEASSLVFTTRLNLQKRELGLHYNIQNKTARILSIRFDGIDAQTLVLLLSNKGVCVSAGAACSSLESHPSHVLKAIGLSDEEARSTIRVSFSDRTTGMEAYDAAEIMKGCVRELKNINV